MHIGLEGDRENDWRRRISPGVLSVNWKLLDEIEIRINRGFGERYAFAFIEGRACYTECDDCRYSGADCSDLIDAVAMKRMLKSMSIDEIVKEIETEIAILKMK